MREPTFTKFHEQTLIETKKKVDDMHAIVTNGLREKVSKIAEQLETLNDPKRRAETCPVIVSRKKQRKSWEWWLVMFVGFSSILSNLGLTDWILEAFK